jgi:hypothetical protein
MVAAGKTSGYFRKQSLLNSTQQIGCIGKMLDIEIILNQDPTVLMNHG